MSLFVFAFVPSVLLLTWPVSLFESALVLNSLLPATLISDHAKICIDIIQTRNCFPWPLKNMLRSSSVYLHVISEYVWNSILEALLHTFRHWQFCHKILSRLAFLHTYLNRVCMDSNSLGKFRLLPYHGTSAFQLVLKCSSHFPTLNLLEYKINQLKYWIEFIHSILAFINLLRFARFPLLSINYYIALIFTNSSN